MNYFPGNLALWELMLPALFRTAAVPLITDWQPDNLWGEIWHSDTNNWSFQSSLSIRKITLEKKKNTSFKPVNYAKIT